VEKSSLYTLSLLTILPTTSLAQENRCPDDRRETAARGARQRAPRFCDHLHSAESSGAAESAHLFLCLLDVKDQADLPRALLWETLSALWGAAGKELYKTKRLQQSCSLLRRKSIANCG